MSCCAFCSAEVPRDLAAAQDRLSLVPCSAKNSLDLADGMVTMGYLNEGRRGFMGGLSKLFGNADNADDNPGEAAGRAEVFICVNASTVELKDIERYAKEYAKGKTLVLWNMELDTLRADLGERNCRPVSGIAGSCYSSKCQGLLSPIWIWGMECP